MIIFSKCGVKRSFRSWDIDVLGCSAVYFTEWSVNSINADIFRFGSAIDFKFGPKLHYERRNQLPKFEFDHDFDVSGRC